MCQRADKALSISYVAFESDFAHRRVLHLNKDLSLDVSDEKEHKIKTCVVDEGSLGSKKKT